MLFVLLLVAIEGCLKFMHINLGVFKVCYLKIAYVYSFHNRTRVFPLFYLKQLWPQLWSLLLNFSFYSKYICYRDTSQQLSIQPEFYFNNFDYFQLTLINILLYFSSVTILTIYSCTIILRSTLRKLKIKKKINYRKW